MSSLETAFWLLFLYYWFGYTFYSEIPELRLMTSKYMFDSRDAVADDPTIIDIVYYLTVTMTVFK